MPLLSDRPIRLAHLAGVPAPYYVPLFRALARDERVDFTVIFASSEGLRPPDGTWFGRSEAWDVDLVSGYRSVFLGAADTTPGLGDRPWSVRNWDIVPQLVRGRYEVLSVAGYNSITYLLGVLAQRALGGEVLFREEQTMLDPRSMGNMMIKQIALRALLRHGRALYTSTENRRWFQHFGVPDERLFFTPFTVDNERLATAATALRAARDELRREFGIDGRSGAVILSVSRLVPEKQPGYLLEAFRQVRSRQPCVLLIVGSGPLEKYLREEVRRKQIPDVVFAGFLNASQISRAYAVADIFVLLSRERETFGLVVNEAMNFALPVVVSDRVGSAVDLVSKDYNGFIVSSRDPTDAARAIDRLARDDRLRTKMGAASAQRIKDWNVARTASGFVEAAAAAVTEPYAGRISRSEAA